MAPHTPTHTERWHRRQCKQQDFSENMRARKNKNVTTAKTNDNQNIGGRWSNSKGFTAAAATNNDESFIKKLQQNPMQTVLHPHNNLLLPTRYLLLPAAVKSPITSSSQTAGNQHCWHKTAGNQYCWHEIVHMLMRSKSWKPALLTWNSWKPALLTWNSLKPALLTWSSTHVDMLKRLETSTADMKQLETSTADMK